MNRIRIRNICIASIVVTLMLALLSIGLFLKGQAQFEALQTATDTYVACEKDAQQLQTASNYLTEQTRLAAMTGESKYIDAYFNEVNSIKSREIAVQDLKSKINEGQAIDALQAANDLSYELMTTEYYAMRLVCEANGSDPSAWQEQIKNVTLSSEDATLSPEYKLQKAQQIVSNEQYQKARSEISEKVIQCTDELVQHTKEAQANAELIFSNTYTMLELSVVCFVVVVVAVAVVLWVYIVRPLVTFNEMIKNGRMLPVTGARETQNLAISFNRIREENKAKQKTIKHQAEHDALTGLLNRGSYDKIICRHKRDREPFALILVDVDAFKKVNDSYGHLEGDRVLKRVADLLKNAFRSEDYVCRIGGDEFAVIMHSMTADKHQVIKRKIEAINFELKNLTDETFGISISAGIAFYDQKSDQKDIYKEADDALYAVKKHPHCDCLVSEVNKNN